MSNQELVDTYINSLSLLSKESIRNRLYFFKQFLNDFKKPIQEITPADLRNYIIKKKESNRWTKATTVAQYITLLKIFFNFLVNEKHLEENPAKSLKSPQQHTTGELRTFNVAEIRLLLKTAESSAIDLRQKLLFYIAMTSGLRASEICSIKKENIDLIKRLIYIPREDVKGQFREKLVPISIHTKDLLELYMKKSPTWSDYLFENRLNKRIDRKVVYLAMRTVIDTAYPYKDSWKKPSGPNIARHTFASRWIESGGDYHALRAIMGWKSFNQLDRYVSVSPEFISRSSLKVEKKLLKV